MTHFRLLLVLIIILLSIILAQRLNTKNVATTTNSVLEEQEDEVIETTSEPTQSPIPLNSYSENVTNDELEAFIYPNATRQSVSQSTVILQSTDDISTITDWYEDKIKDMGLQTKTFVRTNSNGTVLNRLVGSRSSYELSVELRKNADSPQSTITLTIKK